MLSRNSVGRVRSQLEIKILIRASLGKISSKRLLDCAAKIGKALRLKGRLNILLAGNHEIQRLNKKYLNHDRPTDVISFGYFARGQVFSRLSKTCPLTGEIAISLPVTAKQAKVYGNTFFYELCFYICHGMLHIQGWDDRTPALRKRMLEKQSKILKKIGIERSADR